MNVDIVKLDASAWWKFSERHFLKDIWNSFHEATQIGPELHQLFSFWDISTNTVARGIRSFGRNRLWLADWLSYSQFFLSNLHRLVMKKCWKFQEVILIHIWIRAKWLKNCCNNRPTLGNPKNGLSRVGHLFQQILGHLAITPTRIKISSWNFLHLFIKSLCKFDKKTLAIAQSAC